MNISKGLKSRIIKPNVERMKRSVYKAQRIELKTELIIKYFMEQIQELLEILKQTPEMALWVLSLYFLFILLKLASWVYALKVVAQQFIKRYFNYRDKSLSNKRGVEIADYFESCKISSVDYNLLLDLLNNIKSSPYIHESDIRKAIKKIKAD